MGKDYAVNIFVYGTLRTGCCNAGMLRRSLNFQPTRAMLPWSRLYYHDSGLYPVLTRDYSPGFKLGAVGEMVNVRQTDDVADVMFMELNAGYNAEWCNVKSYPFDNDPLRYEMVRALVFTAPAADVDGLVEVEGNDWMQANPSDGRR